MEEAILFRHWLFEHQFPGESKPRTWKLERAKPPMKAAYGLHLERLAIRGINRHREAMDEYAYATAIREWTDGFTDETYAWGGSRFVRSLEVDANRLELAWAWFQQAEASLPNREQMSFAMFRGMFEARAAEITQLLKEMLTEKNPSPPQREEAAASA